jgi:hypothetical protein
VLPTTPVRLPFVSRNSCVKGAKVSALTNLLKYQLAASRTPESTSIAQEVTSRSIAACGQGALARVYQDLTNFRRFVPGAAYHWALDRGQVVTQAFQVRSLDTTIIIDRQGRIAYRDGVPTPLQTLRQAVARVL